MKIKTGDTVKVISGHYKGTVSEVKAVDPKNNQVVVEGVNMVLPQYSLLLLLQVLELSQVVLSVIFSNSQAYRMSFLRSSVPAHPLTLYMQH